MHGDQKKIMEELKNLFDQLYQKEKSQPQWLDGADVMRMLHMCSRTLRKLRLEHELPYFEVKGKIYYTRQDVDEMIMKHRKE